MLTLLFFGLAIWARVKWSRASDWRLWFDLETYFTAAGIGSLFAEVIAYPLLILYLFGGRQ